MEQFEYFKRELSYIKNKNYVEDIKFLLNGLPAYFFEVAASSTGKYHPSYALGNGGLLRHTKAAVRVAYELLNNPSIGDKYTNDEKDLMLIALMLHDGLKSGREKSEYTKAEHPIFVTDYIKENKANLHFQDHELELICAVILSHMGPWNTNYNKEEILPKPNTKYERFVHMCDYLASRKCIHFEFNNNDIID